ncbi:MAG: Fur family transcriptional regulator [Gluconacetobacter sp.]
MLAFPEHRRSPPDIHQIRPGMGAGREQVRRLEQCCREAGLKMTDLRRVLLHGVLEAGPGATAVGIWKTIAAMMTGHAPTQGSIQRNLNLLVEHAVLRREVGPDRVWRYRVPSERRVAPLITFVEAGTGRKIPCDVTEIASLLHRIAAERGLAVQGASVTVVPVGLS